MSGEPGGDELKAVCRRLYEELMTEGDWSRADEVVARGYIDHSPIGDRGGLERLARAMHHAFPDIRYTVERQLAEGDCVCSQVRITGTHRGTMLLPDSSRSFAATGKSSSVLLVDIHRLVEGRIVERWGMHDRLGWLQQLGLF